MLFAGLFLFAGSCLTTAARSEESTRIPGQVLQNGGAPFTDTVRQMVLRDEQIRRDVIAGLRPASDPTAGVTRYRWTSKGTQADGAVFLSAPRAGSGGARSTLGSPGDAPQGMGTNFAGISQQDQIDAFGGAGSAPPDTMGAVGPNHFVTMLRGSVAIYTKTGTRLSHVTLNSFFTTGSYPRGNCYSPRVIFDLRSGRWFAIAVETNGGAANHIILAVSATADPTGTWRKYAILIGETSTRTDEAMLGTDDNGVYFGASMIPSGGAAFGKIGATRKSTLLAASPTLSTVYYWRNITDMMATPAPIHNQDAVATNGFAYFLASSTIVYANIEYRTLQWALSGVPTLSLTTEILTSAYGAPVDAAAQGSATNIDVGDDRIENAVQRANGIWATRNVGVTSSGGSGAVDRTAVEWFRIDASVGGALTLSQLGRVFDSAAANPMSFYYGSAMVTGQGHAALGFSGSSAVSFVGGYTCGRLSSDAANTMQAVAQIKAGLASYDQLIGGRNRWGNYSATSLDPNDDMSLWTIQEYADSTAANPANVWGTWVARLLAPAPLIVSAAGSAVQGVANKTLVVTGSRFFDPGTGYPNHINVTLSGDGISNYVITYNSTTQVTAKFDISLDATIGTRDVTVTNPDGQTATAAGAFEVIRAIPTTVTVDNVAGQIGQTITLRAVLTNNDTSAGIPGKTLAFKVDGTALGSAVTGADGAATLPLAIPEGYPTGDHVITASFAYDGTYRPSEGTGTGTVNKADTTIAADDKTAKIGATVALTATLTRNHDAAPVVNRTVVFKVDGTEVGTDATDAAGVATVNYVVPEGAGVGARVITAEFAGDGSYNAATDDATLTVEKGVTALAVPNVVGTIGTSVDLSATLTVVGAGLPLAGKTVDLKLDGTSIGTDDTDASGVATVAYLIPNGTDVGDHAIGADFAGDANYEGTSGAGTLHVNVNTTLVADDKSGMMGETVALSATLTRADDNDAVPGKSLAFSVDGTAVGTANTDASGVASVNYLIPEAGGVGVRTITVAFAGDVNYLASTDDAALTVLQTPTKMFVPDRVGTIGGNVELRAFLYRNTDSAPIAGRTLDFSVDGTGIGSGVTAATGRAILNWKIDEAAGAGTRTIVGQFAGDADFLPSSNSGTLTVNKSNTVVTGLDRTARNGDNVELKAYLRRSTDLAWVAGRTISFTVDGTAVGSAVTNASGTAALMYNVTNTPGQYPIGYAFAGDAAYNASTGGSTLTVTDNTTLVVDDKTAQIGATVALTATLTRNLDSAPVTGKTVSFKVDGTAVGSGVTDAAGVATTNYLVVVGSGTGARTIEGAFAGDVVYGASTDTGTLTVDAADTTTVADDVTGKIHEDVNLSATVTRVSDSGPVVGGTVNFSVDGTFVGGGATNASGVATTGYTIPEGAGAGARVIEASFIGDAEHNPSTDDATLTVEKADSTLTVNSPSGTAGTAVDVVGSLSTNPPIPGRTIEVSVDGSNVGSAVTDGGGNYTFSYTIPAGMAVGAHTLQADFLGDGSYNPSSASGTLTVMSNTTVTVAPAAGKPGLSATLSATLTADNTGGPLSGKTLTFKVDGANAGSAVTDATGTATVPFAVDDTSATKAITVDFAGDTDYNPSTGAGTLTVVPADTTQYTIARTGIITTRTTLRQFDLKRTTDNQMLSGKTITFKIDGTAVGTGVTNAGGDSTLEWTITPGPASRTITTEFAGDAAYNGSSASATLTAQTVATKMFGVDRTGPITSYRIFRSFLYLLDNTPVRGKTIQFSVDGTPVGSSATDTTGRAQVGYTIQDGAGAGVRTILSQWAGDGGYLASSCTNTLTVTKATPYIWVLSKSVKAGGVFTMYAYFRRLADYQKQVGKSVDFKLDGTFVATVVTDGDGIARHNYTVVEPVGAHTVRCEFAGDAWVAAGFGDGTMNVVP
jgi:hypothetical protein